MNAKLRANLVVDFDFDETEAAHILSDPNPKKALADYLISRHGCSPKLYVGNTNVEYLKTAFGAYLADRRINEAKQLAVSTGGATV